MDWIQELKTKVNIVDFMIQDGLNLKRESGGYSCKCPFHNEKTPSFRVKENEQFFKCFGCDAKGDVIEYFRRRNQLGSWILAARELAKRNGIQIKQDNETTSKYKKIERLYAINKILEKFYKAKFNELSEHHPAKKEILKRNLRITEDFGYAPSDGKETLEFLLKNKITKEELQELGIINEKNNVILINRLIFFIKDYMGNTIGFSGRSLDNSKDYKYVNSKTSVVFDKQSALYNIENAKKKAFQDKEIYLVEGQFDVISMKQNGFENVVATSGTAFTEKHAQLIKRTVSDNGKIFLLLDGDEAGQKAMKRIFESFSDVQEMLYIISLPKDKDPCDYFISNQSLPEPQFYMSYLFDKIKSSFDLNLIENRISFMKTVQDEFIKFISSNTIKQQYLRSAAAISGTSIEDVKMPESKVKKTLSKKKEPVEKVGSVDKIYLTIIGYYVANIKLTSKNLNVNLFPEKYKEFLSELNSKRDLNFIKENYSKKFHKIIDYINEMDTHTLDNEELFNSHLKFLFKTVKNEENKIKENNRIASLTKQIENQDFETVLAILKNIE